MEYTYHPMTLADYDESYALWKSLPGVCLSDADTRDNIARYLSHNPGQSFVCKSDGHLVGILLCGNDGRRAYIHHMAVAPEHRRQGIGHKLVRLAVAEQKKNSFQKCHLFILHENETGKAFWNEMEFSERQDISIMSRSL